MQYKQVRPWDHRYYDIFIINKTGKRGKKLKSLALNSRKAEVKCCLAQKETFTLMNGAARILNYHQYDPAGKPAYLFTMYEGWIKDGDPDNFGRAISGYANIAFVGYFKPCEGHGFWCTKTREGTGLYFRMSRDKGPNKHLRHVKYHGTYVEDQNWEFEPPGEEDTESKWFDTNIEKTKKIKFRK